MDTIISQNPPTKQELNQAKKILKNGGLVALPTETVYGLAVDANNQVAVGNIFSTKKRPIDHPLIIHIDKAKKIDYWANITDPLIKYQTQQLVSSFTPGPITLILPRNSNRGEIASSGKKTIAIRIPDNPIFLEIANAFSGIATPSANLFGRISPTNANHVFDELQGKISLILNGGQCKIGLESTIIKCGKPPIILRTGNILPIEIERCLNTKILVQGHSKINQQLPSVSGSLNQHYAPQKPFFLIDKASQIKQISKLAQNSIAILLFATDLNKVRLILQPTKKLIEFIANPSPIIYASQLYSILREMDNSTAEILIAILPKHLFKNQSWWAIFERLQKASKKN